jgi:hypothetical protein
MKKFNGGALQSWFLNQEDNRRTGTGVSKETLFSVPSTQQFHHEEQAPWPPETKSTQFL